MPRKSTKKPYFDDEVERAVCSYLSTDDQIEREKHFKIIYPALQKIAEVMYHKVKFSYSDDDREDVMANCVAWLVEKMPMFKCGQGTKAFSYYTVTARFYYIQLANKNYNYFKKNIPLSSMVDNWDIENSDKEDKRKADSAKLLSTFVQYCEYNMEKMFPSKLIPYAKAVLDVLSNFEDIEDFRSRKLLQVIYRRNNIKESQKTNINKAVNVMITHMTLFKDRFFNGDDSIEMCVKNTLSDEEIQIVRDTIVVGKKNNGTVALARKFGVDVKVISDYLKTT